MVNKIQAAALNQQHADIENNFQQTKQAYTKALNEWTMQNQAVTNLAMTVVGHHGEVDLSYGALLQRSSGLDELDEQFCIAASVLRRCRGTLRFAERNLKEARAAKRALEALHN